MQIQNHFFKIRSTILDELDKAQSEICVAVAWFTNQELFEKLCLKAKQGINVEIIIVNDEINNRIGGLDWQLFIRSGGKLYFSNFENPIHNKFCLIDENILINGSYNWTYFAENSNLENIILFKGVNDIILGFKSEFIRIRETLNLIQKVNPFRIENYGDYAYKSVFDVKNYLSTDIYNHAIEEQEKGNNKEALNLINLSSFINPTNEETKRKRFEIKEISYRLWNEDYILDKVEFTESETICHFRTIVSQGAWIHGPKAKYAWFIRNTDNRTEAFPATRISDITVNGQLVKEELLGRSILEFEQVGVEKPDNERSIQQATEQGFNYDKNGSPVDENGNKMIVFKSPINSGDILTCRIHFQRLPENVKNIDLIEGKDCDTKANHWHCFDVSLNQNLIFVQE